jgi:hypothetical protein
VNSIQDYDEEFVYAAGIDPQDYSFMAQIVMEHATYSAQCLFISSLFILNDFDRGRSGGEFAKSAILSQFLSLSCLLGFNTNEMITYPTSGAHGFGGSSDPGNEYVEKLLSLAMDFLDKFFLFSLRKEGGRAVDNSEVVENVIEEKYFNKVTSLFCSLLIDQF